jgi:hypothetical protein
MPARKIVVLSTSPFPYGNNITDGPGYRTWNLFQEISRKHKVTILSLYESYHRNLKRESAIFEGNYLIRCIPHSPRNVAKAVLEERPDILYVHWSATPFIGRLDLMIPTIVDYVGAGLLERFASSGTIPDYLLRLKMRSFWFGDFLMTAGLRERYYLIGLLVASKRLSTRDRGLSPSLIHLVPMTAPASPAVSQKNVIERQSNELVILVAGAFLPWYDYSTLFEAFNILLKNGKTNFKCIFFGGNPRNPEFERLIVRMGHQSMLKDKLIFTGLVPFKERASYYLQSDIAVNIPMKTVEDELSVRTRVIDYIWARLPIVTPTSDEHSNMVVANGGGFEYAASDPNSLCDVLGDLMSDNGSQKIAKARKNMDEIYRKRLDIDDAMKPMVDFINNPYVDPARSSPRQYLPDFLLLGRDALRWLKRGVA